MLGNVLPVRSDIEEGTQSEPQELLEDYLDHLCSPLVGIVPYRERDRLRQEAGFNIEGRMQTYLLDGLDPLAAVKKAIDKYGRSDVMCDQFLSEWYRYQPKGWLARKIGLSNAYAALYFGQATFWGLVLVQIRIFAPNPEPYTFGLSLAQVRRIFPEPLPLPDQNPLFGILCLYILIAPVLAGILTGRQALVGAAKAAFHTQLILTLLTFTVGSMMLPEKEGLWLAIVQLFYWVSVGTGTAHLTSLISRRRRMRFRF